MKYPALAPALLFSVSTICNTVIASPQNVKFTGEISNSTCYHTNKIDGQDGLEEITRFLPTVQTYDLPTTGSTAGLTYLTIFFRCPAGVPINNPEMTLLGVNVTPSGAIGNAVPVSAGGAENVSLQVFEYPNGTYPEILLDFSNGPIQTVGSMQKINPDNNEVYYTTLLGVQYFAEFGPAKPGVVRGYIQRAMHYP